MEVHVRKSVESDASFAAFMTEAERVYVGMEASFVLIFRLDFGGVSVRQAARWMQLFERVRPVTEAKLICTCVCCSSPVVEAWARMFTTVYSSIKPFHVCKDYETCLAKAREGLQNNPP